MVGRRNWKCKDVLHSLNWMVICNSCEAELFSTLRAFILFVAPRKALASCQTVTTNNMKLMWLIDVTLKAL